MPELKEEHFELHDRNKANRHEKLRLGLITLNKIKEIYKNRPKGFEVDHIHPISKGGLHVEYNLQYLPKSANRSKGNKI